VNNIVMQCLTEILTGKFHVPSADLGPETRFEELDFDSLVFAELAVILQQRLGVPVAESDLSAEMTLAEAAAMLGAKGVTV